MNRTIKLLYGFSFFEQFMIVIALRGPLSPPSSAAPAVGGRAEATRAPAVAECESGAPGIPKRPILLVGRQDSTLGPR